ncbi:carboxypeptidase regulatory-like domain-containing protein [Foetidibacter luteolus]|uniref:carboxypeptidase regulatory-like domain-containing protein n=1 Tax=Foetidibacter luteolus TaxID=2608880 RepID=UPI00129B9D4B|nr:carboxypeptidase-like regulatory domain-containing protein [Foetidibacter luteolus]
MKSKRIFIFLILGVFVYTSFIYINATGNIKGTVYSRETGEKLDGVQVTIDTEDEGKDRTEADGQYEFVNLELKTYLLKYHKNEYRDESQDVNVRSNGTTMAKDIRLYRKPAIGGLLAELEKNLNQKRYGESGVLVASINTEVANSWETLKSLANRLREEYRERKYEEMKRTIEEIRSEIGKD